MPGPIDSPVIGLEPAAHFMYCEVRCIPEQEKTLRSQPAIPVRTGREGSGIRGEGETGYTGQGKVIGVATGNNGRGQVFLAR